MNIQQKVNNELNYRLHVFARFIWRWISGFERSGKPSPFYFLGYRVAAHSFYNCNLRIIRLLEYPPSGRVRRSLYEIWYIDFCPFFLTWIAWCWGHLRSTGACRYWYPGIWPKWLVLIGLLFDELRTVLAHGVQSKNTQRAIPDAWAIWDRWTWSRLDRRSCRWKFIYPGSASSEFSEYAAMLCSVVRGRVPRKVLCVNQISHAASTVALQVHNTMSMDCRFLRVEIRSAP